MAMLLQRSKMNDVDPHVWLHKFSKGSRRLADVSDRCFHAVEPSELELLQLRLRKEGVKWAEDFDRSPPNPGHYCVASDGSAKHSAHRVWIKRVLSRAQQKPLAP